MNEIFYYYGFLYLARAIYFTLAKEKKEEAKTLQKVENLTDNINDVRKSGKKQNRGISEIQANIKKAEGVFSTAIGMLIKQVSNPRVIFSICDVIWLVAGLFLSDESSFFLLLIIANLSLMIFVAITILKKSANLKKANIIQGIVKITFTLIILYKHFATIYGF